MIILLMGVTGCGKSSIGALLAQKLNFDLIDADDFHSAENIALMSQGKPLNDTLRKPWLASIAKEIKHHCEQQKDLVLACSALKRDYRNTLLASSRSNVLIFLKGEKAEISARLAKRTNHFMPSQLLDSQLDTLQAPEADEAAVEVPVSLSKQQAVSRIINSIDQNKFYSSIKVNPQ